MPKIHDNAELKTTSATFMKTVIFDDYFSDLSGYTEDGKLILSPVPRRLFMHL